MAVLALLFAVERSTLLSAPAPLSPLAPGFADPAERFAGERCSDDCGQKLAGYESALLRDHRRRSDCMVYQGAVRQGCLARVSEYPVRRR